MRRKVYTKEQILHSALDLVEKNGFTKFTARSIAKHMNISTQPIYLEFKNMEELREAVFESIFDNLFKNTLKKVVTGDPVIDLALNFMRFAKKNPRLFRALYIEESGVGHKLYERSFEGFRELAKSVEKYKEIDEVHIDALHTRIWMTATGLAVLTSSDILSRNQEQIVQMVEDVIQMTLENPAPIHVE